MGGGEAGVLAVRELRMSPGSMSPTAQSRENISLYSVANDRPNLASDRTVLIGSVEVLQKRLEERKADAHTSDDLEKCAMLKKQIDELRAAEPVHIIPTDDLGCVVVE